MPVSIIDHQGVRVLFIDYSGMKKKEEMIGTLHEAVEIIEIQPDKIRTLIDLTDAAGSSEWMNESKKYGKQVGDKTLKSAIVGITGMKKVLLMGYNAVVNGRLKPFDTKEQALAYLVKD